MLGLGIGISVSLGLGGGSGGGDDEVVYGALITKAGTQSMTDGAPTLVTWSAVTGYNVTGSAVWTSGDNTKIYVPSGFNFAQVVLQTDWAAAGNRRDATIKLNTDDVVNTQFVPASTIEARYTVSTGLVPVVGGTDYFTIIALSSGSTQNFNANTFAKVRIQFFT